MKKAGMMIVTATMALRMIITAAASESMDD